ncbi:hypothetical protein TNCV_3932521 [Trichonephila clavipes]|nr:hypothetical protein TNCV_3932521 [Trichonephila clavipes]
MSSEKRTKMPTEQAKPAVVTTFVTAMEEPNRPSEERLGKTLSNGLKSDRQKYTRRAEEQLKCRAQRSGSTVLHTKCIRTLPRGCKIL